MDVYDRIHELAHGCSAHPALDNPFYELWMDKTLSAEQVEIVAWNFYQRVRRTPDRIALAFLHMKDTVARAETIENLSDEMGRGNPRKVHSLILREFLEALLSRLYGRAYSFDATTLPIIPSTARLIEEGEKVFSSPRPAEVCGALLAQEWHAYPQLVFLYEGARNYRHLFELQEFHEHCEYFYLHIGATEKEHKIHSLSTAARMCQSSDDLEQLERGFHTYLELLAANWAELHETIQAS